MKNLTWKKVQLQTPQKAMLLETVKSHVEINVIFSPKSVKTKYRKGGGRNSSINIFDIKNKLRNKKKKRKKRS